MKVSVDSIIKKPFCSRNYDEKLKIAKAEKPTPKLGMLSIKNRLLEKVLNVGSRNRNKLSSTSTHLLNKCLHAAANIVEDACTPLHL